MQKLIAVVVVLMMGALTCYAGEINLKENVVPKSFGSYYYVFEENKHVHSIYQDEKQVTLLSTKWIVPEGKKSSDGYLEVTTKSGEVYKIYPCGLIEKLAWKEVAPNTERSDSIWLTIPTLPNNGLLKGSDRTYRYK